MLVHAAPVALHRAWSTRCLAPTWTPEHAPRRHVGRCGRRRCRCGGWQLCEDIEDVGVQIILPRSTGEAVRYAERAALGCVARPSAPLHKVVYFAQLVLAVEWCAALRPTRGTGAVSDHPKPHRAVHTLAALVRAPMFKGQGGAKQHHAPRDNAAAWPRSRLCASPSA